TGSTGTSFGTTGADKTRCWESSRSGSPALPTSTHRPAAGRTPRSISSPRTTASRCGTWSPTTRSTTRRTGRRTRTETTTTGGEGDVGRRLAGRVREIARGVPQRRRHPASRRAWGESEGRRLLHRLQRAPRAAAVRLAERSVRGEVVPGTGHRQRERAGAAAV